MNDDIMIMVREQRHQVPMTTPVDDIVARGRRLRTRRRRLPALAGAAVLAAGAAAITASQPSAPPTQPAAWTVAKQGSDTIVLSIHAMRDPAGLQARLRADGLPATVDFGSPPKPACRPYPATRAQERALGGFRPAPGGRGTLVFHPSALPAGIGLSLVYVSTSRTVDNAHLAIVLIHISHACTG